MSKFDFISNIFQRNHKELLTLKSVEDAFVDRDNMTDVQWADFSKNLIGARISLLTGLVVNVYTKNSLFSKTITFLQLVSVDIAGIDSPRYFAEIEIEKPLSLSLDRGQLIAAECVIRKLERGGLSKAVYYALRTMKTENLTAQIPWARSCDKQKLPGYVLSLKLVKIIKSWH